MNARDIGPFRLVGPSEDLPVGYARPGSTRLYTLEEVAEATGVDVEELTLWQAEQLGRVSRRRPGDSCR